MVKFLSLQELHRLPPLPQDQTSARLRYLTAATTAAQRLRAVGLPRQDLDLSTASVAVAALFVGDLAGMSADRNRCDCIFRGDFIDVERVEGAAVPFV